MKKILTSALVAIIWMAFIYGCFAFAKWELNPKLWYGVDRSLYVVFGGIVGLIIGVAFYETRYIE